MTKRLTKIIDGCYTRLLGMALNINQYMMRITNSELYGKLPNVSSKVAQRRMKLAGHAQRHPELTLHSEPLHGSAGRGRPRQTYIDTLMADTGLQLDTRDIANIMEHRERWRDIVHGSRGTLPDLSQVRHTYLFIYLYIYLFIYRYMYIYNLLIDLYLSISLFLYLFILYIHIFINVYIYNMFI